jgi:replication initiation and membrane attachment protein DnaB
VQKELIKIFPVDTKDQIAYALTKPLAQNDFQRHWRFMLRQVTFTSNQS